MTLRFNSSGLSKLTEIWVLIVLGLSAAALAQAPTPPVATVIPKADTLFGEVRIDNYFWLRDRTDPDVFDYLEAENEYTKMMMTDTEALQEQIFKEIIGRIKETDLSVPEKVDNYYYYSRTEQGKEYAIHCRKLGSLEAPEEILLDENELAVGKEYLHIGAYGLSPNHQLLAYSVDTTGGEVYTLYVKNLQTGKLLSDRVPNVGNSIAWAADNHTLFYDVLDETYRPYRIYRHVLGSAASADKLIFEEPDDHYFVDVALSRNKRWIMIDLGSETTSEALYLDANNPLGEFKVVQPRQAGVEYYVFPHDDQFFIITNDNALNFKVMTAPASNPGKANWKEFLPYREEIRVESMKTFKDYVAISERQNGLIQLKIVRLSDKAEHNIEFPEATFSAMFNNNPDFNSRALRFTYFSLTTQKSVFEYDMESRERKLLKQDEIPSGYDATQYQAERIFATAPDGVQVPIALVYRKDKFRKDGTNPVYLDGYGAYGIPEDPWFSVARISLLDRGFVFAIAQVRGGGEMGRPWYYAGRLLNKKNTFTDFIACAEHLIKEKYAATDKVIAYGGSAGGLLVGSVLTMRPDLWGAVVADVPFVDLINTMSDSTIPLTVTEWEEWGNPLEPEYYSYMRSYSPYDNIRATNYPPILITAGLNDPRVAYWEPAKFCAKLRAMKTDGNLLLLKTNMDAGHGGASGRYEAYKEIAFEYAFLLKVLKLQP